MTEDDVENPRSHAHMLLLAVEAGDPKPELLMRVKDMVKALPPPALDMEKVEKALEVFGGSHVAENVDAEGWTSRIGHERICDWFGPSDFREAASLLSEIRKARGAALERAT